MDKLAVRNIIYHYLPEIDDPTYDYLSSLIFETETLDFYEFSNSFGPFIASYGDIDQKVDVDMMCHEIYNKLLAVGLKMSTNSVSDSVLLEKSVLLSQVNKVVISRSEQQAMDTLWGLDQIRFRRNEDMKESTEAASAKYERKAAKEQKKWLADLESKYAGDNEDGNQISTMTLPDLSGNNREKDIIVSNFSITYGGQLLLEETDLRIVGCKTMFVGVGKTTLLKHMANFSIEGFPRHHRVLHVKQEVKSSEQTVLQVVLESDVERTNLLRREQELSEKQRTIGDNAVELQKLMNELSELHDRMTMIGVENAESRAASILSGLQFTQEMQNASTSSLSGGWRMRVSLAGALFIQPDLLMLDEPTNHLDLEAVLWLEEYLKGYPNTVLLVSHDRAFLNEVCTDIILFQKLKLNYYRGNYDSFEATRKEMQIVQQKQHEAQKVKLEHMQEFVDKFRYNAKRASLVQSRIKAIERETVVEAVEVDETFSFSFIDAGQLGRPIIQVEGVTFGFHPSKILFKNVHFGIDQSSRIALVGNNGVGKSTLLNLIQGKITPSEGCVKVNPQLRIGVFTQHHMDSFDLVLSPLQNMMNRWPLSGEAELRAHLGRYEITGNDAVKPMKFSSGGQKSRVAFATLTYAKPHVVILDEPTNHLDMGAIDALTNALKAYTGGVLVISHDQHFITHVCNEIWMIANQKVTRFDGEFEDYKKLVLSKHKGGSSHGSINSSSSSR